ncbi:hypothetical protein KJ586_00075 [Patescibacteria group bacterium]|nr:hypothetical protein [Patescibacteria group bacterium]MBU4454902.1 hypothetical protein [Patescibacteria group bacterium]
MTVQQIFYISIVLLFISLFLYKKKKFMIRKADKLIMVLGALVLTSLSLLVIVKKIGGTIMQTVHGWPHFYLIHYIQDVVDGILIGKWNFISGGLFMYPLVNFIFYLSIILFFYLIVRLFTQSEKKITFVLLAIIIVLSTLLIASQKIKELYIKHEIKEANYCHVDLDCKDAGNKCPFGCSAYVNKNEAARINRLFNSFHSNCTYGCLLCANLNIKCENNKCKTVCER